jgi:hypothetical protein
MKRRVFLARCIQGFAAGLTLRGRAPAAGPGAGAILGDDLDATLRWILDTPRDRSLGKAARLLRDGLPQATLRDATLLAAVAEIRPPPVGFSYHAVMAAHAHRLLLGGVPEPRRVAPLLWYLDLFKEAQERVAGGAGLGVPPTRLPPAEHARARLTDALAAWDAEAADAAVTACARELPVADVLEPLLLTGTRCLADLGHKAIATAVIASLAGSLPAARRVPVLRSLVVAQLARGPTRFAAAFATNTELMAQVPAAWEQGRDDAGAAREILAAARTQDGNDLAALARAQLASGIGPAAVWDGIVMAAAERVLQSRDIGSLHAFTAVNAQHTIARIAQAPRTRLLALLQAAAWLPSYRERRFAEGVPASAPRIDGLTPEAMPAAGSRPGGLAERVLAGSGADRLAAARRAVGLAADAARSEALCASARDLVLGRGAGSHDYKFLGSVLEELPRVGPAARAALLAVLPMHLPDPEAPEAAVTGRIREAMD